MANSARYLVSPVLAGLLLSAYDIRLLLVIDICTFFVTLAATAVVRKGFETKKNGTGESMTETVCSLGMLAMALIIGITGIPKKHACVLGVSLALAGVFMVIFALKENIVLICVSGFLFFAMLPLANSSLDYLARTNIPDELQGRAWGFIGLLSQLGYIPAFAFAGVLADRAAGTMKLTVGRGSALVIGISGVLLIAVSMVSLLSGRIRNLESGAELEANRNEHSETL